MESIRLHPEHGVNSCLSLCPVCLDPVGVALLGYNGGNEAPRAIVGEDFCDHCTGVMNKGAIYLIETYGEPTPDDPKRTGRLVAVTEESFLASIAEDVPQEQIDATLRMRACFVGPGSYERLGLDKLDWDNVKRAGEAS